MSSTVIDGKSILNRFGFFRRLVDLRVFRGNKILSVAGVTGRIPSAQNNSAGRFVFSLKK